MFDGCLLRQRGPGWGQKKTEQPRVAWHEQKVGVFYRHEQNAEGQLTQKVVVNWQGEPVELGERLRSPRTWPLGRPLAAELRVRVPNRAHSFPQPKNPLYFWRMAAIVRAL